MIDETQREKLKEHLQNDYTTEVLKVLEKAKVTAKNGKPYSQNVLIKVFNGDWQNQDIEDAIFKVYKRRKAKAKRVASNREKILSE